MTIGIHFRSVSITTALVLLVVGRVSAATSEQCYDILTSALKDQSPTVRAHAAEALVWLKRPEPALAAFRGDADTSEPQYRIIVWRVLAAAEPEPSQRRRYVERIRQAFLVDPKASDQTHAIEALAKLREAMTTDAERKRVRATADEKGPAAPFALWRLAQAGDSGAAAEQLLALLNADDRTTRIRAAYVLGRLQPLSPTMNERILAALSKESPDSPVRSMLRAALGHDEARHLASDATVAPTGRYFAVMRLAECGSADDRVILLPLLTRLDTDLRVAAACAVLAIDARADMTTPTTQAGGQRASDGQDPASRNDVQK